VSNHFILGLVFGFAAGVILTLIALAIRERLEK
jgi:hypothetical protein